MDAQERFDELMELAKGFDDFVKSGANEEFQHPSAGNYAVFEGSYYIQDEAEWEAMATMLKNWNPDLAELGEKMFAESQNHMSVARCIVHLGIDQKMKELTE